MDKLAEKAKHNLVDREHKLSTKEGVLDFLTAIANGLVQDIPEMPVEKARACIDAAGVSMRGHV